MAGTLVFKHRPDVDDGRNPFGDRDCSDLCKQLRKTAKKRGLKLPKRISTGGAYHSWWYVSFTTNVMRDLIIEIARKMGLVMEPGSDYSITEYEG